jgi:hypothetical protein
MLAFAHDSAAPLAARWSLRDGSRRAAKVTTLEVLQDFTA